MITAMRRYPENPGIIDLWVEQGFWFWKKFQHRAVSHYGGDWHWCDTGRRLPLQCERMLNGFVDSNAIQWVLNEGFIFEEKTDD